ncbi:MAG: ferrous iron transport protein A [Caldilineaceae bacterium]|nr:ferrous iron transport protein A [Caldilineaceae bacterium]
MFASRFRRSTVPQPAPDPQLPSPPDCLEECTGPCGVGPMPLCMAGRGETVCIHEIQGGRQLRQRLLDLGLNHGSTVRLVKNEMPDPLILAVKEDGRLALGRSMAQRILVTPTQRT